MESDIDVESTRFWDLITERLDRFVSQWESGAGTPPQFRELLDDLPESVRKCCLTEMIKLDMDYRTRNDFPFQRVEDYLSLYPDLIAIEQVEPDLIYEEYHIRRMAGEHVSIGDYLDRFPRQADALRRLIEAESESATTTLYSKATLAQFSVGEQVGDFDLLAKLGKGAFATVFLARQRSLQRLVALKVSANTGSEPQTLARMDHPNIGHVYDQVVIPEKNCRLLYMKYVPGGTLQDVIQFSQQFPPRQRDGSTLVRAVDQSLDKRGETAPQISSLRMQWLESKWARTVCDLGIMMADALEYAHSQGVLHRDLKPANILLTAEGAPQLVDFNVSFCSKLDGASPAAFFGGSLAYMSPEQMQACDPNNDRQPDSLTVATDVYSLGIVLWELYFGVRPFEDQSLGGSWSGTLDTMFQRRLEPPQPVAEMMQRSDPQRDSLLEVLRACMQSDPAERIPSAERLKHELQLSSNLAAKRILRPKQKSLLGFAQRHPHVSTLMVLLIPNLIAGGLNLVYNVYYIVNVLCPEEPLALSFAQGRFQLIQGIINCIAFPVGIMLIYLGLRPIASALKTIQNGGKIDGRTLKDLRHRTLRFGSYVVAVLVSIWCVAGILYPFAMHLSGVLLTTYDCLHLLGSLVICGIMGNAYPYVAQTYLSLRAFYPNLIDEDDETHLDDIQPLKKLSVHTYVLLVLSIMLPMLTVMLMVGLDLGGTKNEMALVILSGISLVGTAMAFRYTRIIQAAVRTLIQFFKQNASLSR